MIPILLALALVGADADSTVVPEVLLGRTQVGKGDGFPVVVALTSPDTLTRDHRVRVASSGAVQLWPARAGDACGSRSAQASATAEWSGRMRGDTILHFCGRLLQDEPVRIVAIARAGAAGAPAVSRIGTSETTTVPAPWYRSAEFLAIVTAVLGFLAGIAGSLVQLHAQRRQRRMELDAEERKNEADRASAERARLVGLESAVFTSLDLEIQRNAASLRNYIARPIQSGEKPEVLALAGMQRVLEDDVRREYLHSGPRRDYFEQVQRVYKTMRDYNRAVRLEPDPAKRRERARIALDSLTAWKPPGGAE
jgi:hypothetical protein